MSAANIPSLTERSRQVVAGHHCPECGNKMVESDQRYEGQAVFVWYECGRNDCDGQWLRKISRLT